MRLLRRFFTNWQNIVAILLLGAFAGMALAAPWLAPSTHPDDPVPMQRIAPLPGRTITSLRQPIPPGPRARLGTAPGGWDIYYTLIWGTRSAFRIGLVVSSVAASFGTLLGAISGYVGGRFNRILLRVADAFLTIPALAIFFLFEQVLMPAQYDAPPTQFQNFCIALGLDPIMLALMLISWMPYMRIMNTNIVRLKQTDYALAAKTIGAGPARILLLHLLPNAITPVIVLLARDIGGMVTLDAAFTFIGVGGSSPWGLLLVNGRDWILGPGGNPLATWWVFVPITSALVLFSVGWNLLGDGLNRILNPYSAARVQD